MSRRSRRPAKQSGIPEPRRRERKEDPLLAEFDRIPLQFRRDWLENELGGPRSSLGAAEHAKATAIAALEKATAEKDHAVAVVQLEKADAVAVLEKAAVERERVLAAAGLEKAGAVAALAKATAEKDRVGLEKAAAVSALEKATAEKDRAVLEKAAALAALEKATAERVCVAAAAKLEKASAVAVLGKAPTQQAASGLLDKVADAGKSKPRRKGNAALQRRKAERAEKFGRHV